MPPAPEDPEDGALMARVQSGDDAAFDQLMRRWELPLRRFLQRWTGNEADACDLAQETFVRVHRARDRYRAGARFSTWLFAIAMNQARDGSRRRRARPVVYLEEEALAAAAGASEAGAGHGAAADLVQAETAAAVRAAVQDLPEPLRTAVVLCEYEGLPQAEAAAVAGCSVKAVETRLYRARAALRIALAKYLGGGLSHGD